MISVNVEMFNGKFNWQVTCGMEREEKILALTVLRYKANSVLRAVGGGEVRLPFCNWNRWFVPSNPESGCLAFSVWAVGMESASPISYPQIISLYPFSPPHPDQNVNPNVLFLEPFPPYGFHRAGITFCLLLVLFPLNARSHSCTSLGLHPAIASALASSVIFWNRTVRTTDLFSQGGR